MSERRTTEHVARLVANGPLEFRLETIPQTIFTAVLCSVVCRRDL
jgi:hypothetical protein